MVCTCFRGESCLFRMDLQFVFDICVDGFAIVVVIAVKFVVGDDAEIQVRDVAGILLGRGKLPFLVRGLVFSLYPILAVLVCIRFWRFFSSI